MFYKLVFYSFAINSSHSTFITFLMCQLTMRVMRMITMSEPSMHGMVGERVPLTESGDIPFIILLKSNAPGMAMRSERMIRMI